MEEEPPVTTAGEAVMFGEISRAGAADMVQAGIAAGNIYRQAADAEVMALPEVSGDVWCSPMGAVGWKTS
jgi:hypothetical protein